MNSKALILIRFSLYLLLTALVVGVLIAFAFFDKDLWSDYFTFERLRPIHVSAALFWIFSGAQGAVVYFIGSHFSVSTDESNYLKWSRRLWMMSVVLALGSFLFAQYGGREYWEFPPIFNLPILLSWLAFAAFLYPTVLKHIKKQPVYVWMWCTGVLFFVFSFIEANLWLIPWFRENYIRDVTIQWKANGAIVGSWNQLIYGCAFFLMTRISGSKEAAYSKTAFFFYFLGMANLMFNWGHHVYNVPTAPWVRIVSYAVSMTEWVFLLKILYAFRKKWKESGKLAVSLPYQFLTAAEVWVFLNLLLALVMSVPAWNRYTHGTHAVVAHAMGTTIGINSMILMAAILYIIQDRKPEQLLMKRKKVISGLYLSNISLLVFWVCLIAAGIVKSRILLVENGKFEQAMAAITPYLYGFSWAGVGLLLGLGYLAVLALLMLRK